MSLLLLVLLSLFSELSDSLELLERLELVSESELLALSDLLVLLSRSDFFELLDFIELRELFAESVWRKVGASAAIFRFASRLLFLAFSCLFGVWTIEYLLLIATSVTSVITDTLSPPKRFVDACNVEYMLA